LAWRSWTPEIVEVTKAAQWVDDVALIEGGQSFRLVVSSQSRGSAVWFIRKPHPDHARGHCDATPGWRKA